MKNVAQKLRAAGRYGDDHLVHMNERELGYLSSKFGEPTTNPETGLPEFFDFGGFLSSIIAPIVGSAIGAGPIGELIGSVADVGDWGQTIGGAISGGLTSGLLNNFNPGQMALGAGLGAATPSLGSALGFSGSQSPFNIPELFDLPSALGMSSSAAAAQAAMQTGGSYDSIGNLISSQGLGATAANGAGAAGGAAPGAAANTGIMSAITRNPGMAMALLGGVGALAAGSGGGTQATSANPPQAQPVRPSSWQNYQLPNTPMPRTRTTPSNVRVGAGEHNFFSENQLPDVPISSAKGGRIAKAGRATPPASQLLQEPIQGALSSDYIRGPGDGRADVIPANLSNNEFVMDAETVALLGDGSPDAGARKFEDFRRNLRRHKGRALARGKFSPRAKSVEGYLGGSR